MENNFIVSVKRAFGSEVKFDDKRYHNTKLLLTMYNNVIWRMQDSISDLDDECYEMSGKRLTDLIDCLIDDDTSLDKEDFESRLRCFAKTKAIIEMVDRSLVMLKSYPKHGKAYFDILYHQYISANSYSERDMLDLLHLEKSTFYRRKKDAINLLGVALWGYVLPELKDIWHLEVRNDTKLEQSRE